MDYGKSGKKAEAQIPRRTKQMERNHVATEETLGGMRIIKAFIAEDKMISRFVKCSNEFRDATNRVAMRQSLAHPMSEFLGTVLIVLVLWFGGSLILSDASR